MTIGYAPNGSNWHDHLCRCPGCVPDDPDPTDEEILEMAWRDLQAVPSYVERYAQDERWLPVVPSLDVEHTIDAPFCDDEMCPCHNLTINGQTFVECIEQPITDGLLTTAEGLRLYWGEQI